nr:hypothetical protein BaRGS_000310 [Batillaria attramentaria]
MICYSTPSGVDVEMSSVRKPKHSTTTAPTTYYDRNHEEDWCKVVTTQPDGTNLSQHTPHGPRSYMGLAVVVLVCFNIPFGIVAVILSVKSNHDYQKGNCQGAKRKGKASMAVLASSHVRPESRSSQCKLLLQVCLGRPLFLFPCGFHSSACLVMLQGSFRRCLSDHALVLFVWISTCLVRSNESIESRNDLAKRQ